MTRLGTEPRSPGSFSKQTKKYKTCYGSVGQEIVHEIRILPFWKIMYAQSRICPWKWRTWIILLARFLVGLYPLENGPVKLPDIPWIYYFWFYIILSKWILLGIISYQPLQHWKYVTETWICKVGRLQGDSKVPFSIATTLRGRERRSSFPWIAPLYPWYIPYDAEC